MTSLSDQEIDELIFKSVVYGTIDTYYTFDLDGRQYTTTMPMYRNGPFTHYDLIRLLLTLVNDFGFKTDLLNGELVYHCNSDEYEYDTIEFSYGGNFRLEFIKQGDRVDLFSTVVYADIIRYLYSLRDFNVNKRVIRPD